MRCKYRVCIQGCRFDICFFVLMCLCTIQLYASDYMKPHVGKPQAIFIMLQSESNKIKYFASKNDTTSLRWILEDATKAAQALVNDFNSNFNFCPVYFFMDTDLGNVMEKKFKNVIFTCKELNNRKFVDSINYDKYWIIRYGKPEYMERLNDFTASHQAKRHADSSLTSSNNSSQSSQIEFAEPWGQGLIINDSQFKQIGYFCKMVFLDGPFKTKCAFKSDHFDIQYIDLARKLNSKLKE